MPDLYQPITRFTGDYSFLSNFYPCQVNLWVSEFEQLTVGTVEAAYQASKTLDKDLRRTIAHSSPGDAKRLGRSIQLRPDWIHLRLKAMDFFLRQKFDKIPFSAMLLSTGQRQLIEGNTWGDTFWGVCEGVGENQLGKMLMSIREELWNTR